VGRARQRAGGAECPAIAAGGGSDRVGAEPRCLDPGHRTVIGQVELLELDDRVQRLPGAELARQITTVIRHAEANLAAKVASEVQQTVGADTETGRAVIRSFETRFLPQTDDEPDGVRNGQ
jgi:hypothetical protein